MMAQKCWNNEAIKISKYLISFWRNVKMSLINYEFNLYLNWSKNFVIVVTNVVDKGGTLLITDAKLYVLVVTLSTQDNEKLLQH